VVIATLVGMVVSVVHKADSVEDQMVMYMVFIDMCSQDELIFSAQDFLSQLYSNLMGFFRRDFSRFKCLNQVPSQVGSFVNGMLPCPGEFNIGCLRGTTKG